MNQETSIIAKQLKEVKSVMRDCLQQTRLAKVIPPDSSVVGSGKMLRAQLTLYLGQSTGASSEQLIHAAAAVEIIHGASLLHDDVIDGGILRRGAPTFWKKHGINGAILLGDMLVFKALHLLANNVHNAVLNELIEMSMHVCQSEVEQELVLRGTPGTWAECEQIARRKTGSLFAFAAVAASDEDDNLRSALREAGFILGTAYQLADDVLDASGNEAVSGKTLGTDDERGKTTAITATKDAPENPIDYIYNLLDNSTAQLADWPEVQANWVQFLNVTMKPVLSKHLTAGSK